MRLVFLSLFVLAVQASWFGADDKSPYDSWDTQQLTAWLKAHDVPLPQSAQPPTHKYLQELVRKHWSNAQATASDYSNQAYDYGQHVLQAGKQRSQSAFDAAVETWDESALRQFLLDRGVVNPKGPREQLVQAAKQKYVEYMRQMGSASAYVAQTTAEVGRKASEQRDWAYATWDDSQFREFLVSKGLLKSKEQATRDEMLDLFEEWYRSAADPVYEAWSDSYMHEWLFNHNIPPFTRDPPAHATLLERIKAYYYDVTQKVWNTWTESQLKAWLIDRNIIRSDAQIQREKLERLVSDNYLAAKDVLWSAWSDTDIRLWLLEHDVVSRQTADKMTRDQLVAAIDKKYHDASARAQEYLVWPDARLRAYLRERGMPEDALPTERPGLLQETRIRWVQTTHASEALYTRILALMADSRHIAEEKLRQIFEILTGGAEWTKHKAEAGAERADEAAAKAKAEL